jgi:SAM-dependent methyltransferase
MKQPLATLKPAAEGVLGVETRIASAWAANAHRRLMAVQWRLPPEPKHFDHHIDLFYQWLATRNPLWLERGVFTGLALKGGDVLDIACGDGFYARNFYSVRSRRVVACDYDPKAIKAAKRKNRAPNVEYLLADIRLDLPKGSFENIVLDAALAHFTPNEIDSMMENMKSRLSADGIVSGYTIVKGPSESKQLSHHEYEFRNKEDLLRFITPHFEEAVIFETIYFGRHNLYFWASDRVIPFDPQWPSAVRANR